MQADLLRAGRRLVAGGGQPGAELWGLAADFSRRRIEDCLLFLPVPLFRNGHAPESRLRQNGPPGLKRDEIELVQDSRDEPGTP